MRSFFVVHSYPVFSDVTYLIEIGEQIRIQHFGSVGLVEAFYERILVRLSGLDVAQLHAIRVTPVHQRLRD